METTPNSPDAKSPAVSTPESAKNPATPKAPEPPKTPATPKTPEPPKASATPKTPESGKEKSGKKRGLLFFLIFSLIGNGVLGWLLWTEKNKAAQIITEKETVIVERDNVKNDLVQLKDDYSNLQTSNKQIQGELDDKKARIDSLIKEADKHKGDAWVIAKLKKETVSLREIMRSYVHTIDSLNGMNKTLLKENVKVRSEFLSEKEKTNSLNREKEDLQNVINTGSILQASGTKAMAIVVRSGGKKESETKKARKADKIKVSLTIAANTIAKKGKREVYLRLITPDGKELSRGYDDANSFSFNGKTGFFCARASIDYQNIETPVNLYAESAQKFLAGKYMIEVYCDQNLMGATSLVLE
jgi:hypothetical protein